MGPVFFISHHCTLTSLCGCKSFPSRRRYPFDGLRSHTQSPSSELPFESPRHNRYGALTAHVPQAIIDLTLVERCAFHRHRAVLNMYRSTISACLRPLSPRHSHGFCVTDRRYRDKPQNSGPRVSHRSASEITAKHDPNTPRQMNWSRKESITKIWRVCLPLAKIAHRKCVISSCPTQDQVPRYSSPLMKWICKCTHAHGVWVERTFRAPRRVLIPFCAEDSVLIFRR